MQVSIHDVTQITRTIVVHSKSNAGWEFTTQRLTIKDENGNEVEITLFNKGTHPVPIYSEEIKEI